jgi:hypothetical protein
LLLLLLEGGGPAAGVAAAAVASSAVAWKAELLLQLRWHAAVKIVGVAAW